MKLQPVTIDGLDVKETVAHHEDGHALVAELSPHGSMTAIRASAPDT
jgi:ATP-dependent Zn protease